MADTLHQAEEAIRLEPCPWCGGTDLNSYAIEPHKHVFAGMPDHPGSHVIECFAPDCPAGCVAENEEAARAIWNRRPAQDADARDAAELRERYAAIVEAARAAFDEAEDKIDFVEVPSHLAAVVSVHIDDFDSAMAQARKEGGNG